MGTLREVELRAEIHADASEVADLQREFKDSVEHRGSGTRRDPAIIWQELTEATANLCAATAEACDEIERRGRGLL
jgi:hypothetical protein